MKAGLFVEIRLPQGSVSFASEIAVSDINTRTVKTELLPGQTVRIPIGLTVGQLALIAAQTQFASEVDVDGEKTVLEGQNTTDFGLLWCVRNDEEFGDPPFPPNYETDSLVTSLAVTNTSQKKNQLFLMVAEREPLPPAVDADESAD